MKVTFAHIIKGICHLNIEKGIRICKEKAIKRQGCYFFFKDGSGIVLTPERCSEFSFNKNFI